MYHQQYFSLPYHILSSDGSASSTIPVVGVLKEMSCIKTYERVTYGDDWDFINFYNDTMPTANNWKVNRANALVELGLSATAYTERIPSSLFRGIHDLYELVRSEHFDFNVSRQDKYMASVLEQGVTPVILFTFLDKVVGVKIVSNDFLNVAYIHSAKDISPLSVETIAKFYTDGDVTVARNLKKFLGTYEERFTNDCLLNNMGFDAVFNDGLIDKTEKGLYEHKAEHYKKTIKYKIEKI